MARQRSSRRREGRITLKNEFEKVIAGVNEEMADGMVNVMKKIAAMGALILEREMRNAGLQRSEDTGSAEKMSAKAKSYRAKTGSIFDITHGVKKGKGNKMIAYFGSPDGSWVMNFWAADGDHKAYGVDSHMTLNEIAMTDAKGIDRKVKKIVQAEAESMLRAEFERLLKKSKFNKQKREV